MSGKITQERLEAIRQRAEKATAGPWTCTDSSVESKYAKSYWWGGEDNEVCSLSDGGEYIENLNAEADAKFIAHARQDIPDLLAEVERLRNEINFIANVDMSRAYDAEHVAVSVKSWALNVLEGVDSE